ncbi:Methyltransferase HemK [metagenome]|uniref:Methyltransferase HemK n=1 Tax=metagenome TaxID=256318 RepID=A0A2P2CJ11_9ZZZZ
MTRPADAPSDDALVARLRAAGCVWAEDEAALLREGARSGAELDDLVARRVAGEPLELVLGWVRFLGRRLAVAPGVFVPRRRTELLARTALDHAAHRDRAVVVEMCCGVAPVAACFDGPRHEAVDVHAADLSQDALDCARHNAPTARLHLGDLYDALPAALAGRVDVLAANAPYVPTDRIASMPAEARDHEPRAALDGGAEGVDLHRRLAAEAVSWLAPGGVLLVETSPGQSPLTTAAMAAAGLVTEVLVDDEVGGCVAVGRLPGGDLSRGAAVRA